MPSHMTLQSIVVFFEFKDNEKLTRTAEQQKKHAIYQIDF